MDHICIPARHNAYRVLPLHLAFKEYNSGTFKLFVIVAYNESFLSFRHKMCSTWRKVFTAICACLEYNIRERVSTHQLPIHRNNKVVLPHYLLIA
jgi:hypothetical protein